VNVLKFSKSACAVIFRIAKNCCVRADQQGFDSPVFEELKGRLCVCEGVCVGSDEKNVE